MRKALKQIKLDVNKSLLEKYWNVKEKELDIKYYKALYEGNWYDISKIDWEYCVLFLKTGNGIARIHMCYIDELIEKE